MICHESGRLRIGFGRTNTITLPYYSLAFTTGSSRKSAMNLFTYVFTYCYYL